ncbi:hypothetical protein MJ904_15555 [Massilia sp. MB5]|uniref:hypothetical protein n=1 Tax=Massilia sp. MB5 TaxID=2919578 RepID=UPI001F1129DF|nr:hypothetical protein [Massilia sp. MB5]UMR33466.1 hypothetical protein MJ904_15555 [Massilia sp. MB5]
MSYTSDILDKANNLNPNSTASDLYLFAKAINEAGITEVPRVFVQAVKSRYLNPATNDPNEVAYLQKILNYTNSWAMQGTWYTGDGVVRNISSTSKVYPAYTIADLLAPQQVAIFSTPGTTDFLQMFKQNIPYWYKDTSLFRVRVWGAGGGGARTEGNNPNFVCGGAGGGYSEGVISYASIKANPAVVVGGGGSTSDNSPGAAGGASSFGGTLISASGGAGGYMGSGKPASGAAPGTGAGTLALYTAMGGAGGAYTAYVATNSWSFPAGSGGGAAGGPWGAGGAGGAVDITGNSANGGSGGGTGSNGQNSSASDRNGGISTAYQDRWKTVFLQSLGGVPGGAAQKQGGFGAGGGGGNVVYTAYTSVDIMRNGGHGGAFAGGGGLGGGGIGMSISTAAYYSGSGGIGAGGGGSSTQGGASGTGFGGNGLVIVEWFV